MVLEDVRGGLCEAMASGISAPFGTIMTRLQTVRDLAKEVGLAACYRGLGPRCASMSMSAATTITTHEFLNIRKHS
ncbi:hypothetical protein V6N13_051718 [Hibiscus sabdariffa]